MNPSNWALDFFYNRRRQVRVLHYAGPKPWRAQYNGTIPVKEFQDVFRTIDKDILGLIRPEFLE